METVKCFFDEVDKHIGNKENIISIKSVTHLIYPFFKGLDVDIHSYTYKIANKLLILDDNVRKVYARLFLKAYDHNFTYTFIGTEEVTVDFIMVKKNETSCEFYLPNDALDIENGSPFEMSYNISKKYDEPTDLSQVIDSCEHFLSLVSDMFNDFGIDLRVEYESLSDYLEYDYSDIGYEKKIIKRENKIYKNQSFTTARQVIAIETILSHLDIDISNTDRTIIAKFFQFITGKQADSLPKDTNAYKLIGKQCKTDKKYNEDCDFVASQFELIGLFKLANLVKSGKESEI